MQLISAKEIESTWVEKDGSVILRLVTDEGGQVAVTLPAAAAASLAPALVMAKRLRNPTDEQVQALAATSVRAAFHPPSGRPLVIFDEGTEQEAHYSLSPVQVPDFVDQLIAACREYLRRRN